MKLKTIQLIVALSVILFVNLACGLSVRDGKLSVPISLNEESLIRLVSRAQSVASSTTGSELLVEVENIDFIEPDTIKATGMYTLPSGQRVNGTADIKFSVVDNRPKVEITGINIPGVDLASNVIQQANEALSDAFQREIEQTQESALIKSITVEDDTLKILVEVTIRK